MSVSSPPKSLDLRQVDTLQRAVTWSRKASDFFPGLSVQELHGQPVAGSIQGHTFASGALWQILSPSVKVTYEPRHAEAAQTFSVMLQLHGSTTARQQRHSCRLRSREICLIDGMAPFELEVDEVLSQFVFLQLPRQLVLARHPYLERRGAIALETADVGTLMLGEILVSLVHAAPLLEDDQCATTLIAVAQLLGVPKAPNAPPLREIGSRVRTALAFIDAQLPDPTLDASRVARDQGVSRRWLDELLLRATGSSLSAQIWLRRLHQAASHLHDPAHASRTVTEIAFSVGFEDAAHFTRMFKRHYHCTPRAYRLSRVGHV